jgi:outer membrane protein insertion porin family
MGRFSRTPGSLLFPFLLTAFIPLFPGAESLAQDPSRYIREIHLDESAWQWKGDLREALNLRVGDIYRPEDVTGFLNLLQASGNFQKVDLVTVFSPEGISLHFELTPHELVSEVIIRGNFALLKKEIRAVVRTTPYEIFDGDEAEEDLSRIFALYRQNGFFGTKVKLLTRNRDDDWGIDVIFEITEGNPGVIQKVFVEGNRFFYDEEIGRLHRLLSFSFYEPEKIEEARERLLSAYRRAGYIKVRIETESRLSFGVSLPSISLTRPLKSLTALLPGEYVGIEIHIKITEGDRYEIEVEGAEQVEDTKIRELITFYRTGFLDQYEAEESRDSILNHYLNNGFYHATVDYFLEEGSRSVRFVIDEGVRAKLDRIQFWGNRSVPEKTLRKLMDSRPGFFGPKYFQAAVLESDLKKIEAYYLSQGFVKASTKVINTSFKSHGERIEMIIQISEGPRSRVEAVGFFGNDLFSGAELVQIIGWKPGDVYSPDWVERSKTSVLERYAGEGYADCEINALLKFSPDFREVYIEFLIREGRQRRMGRMLVVGNFRTGPHVLTREFDLKEGELFDPRKILTGRRRLFDLGFFSRVTLVPSEPAVGDRKDLVIQVRERNTGKISLGVGYDSKERLRGFIEFRERNLWGTARGFRFKYKLSTIGRRYDAVYKEPWFLGLSYDINFNLFDEFKQEQERGYDILRRGVRTYTDIVLSRFASLNLGYRFEQVDLSDVEEGLLELEDPLEEYRIGSLQASITFDHRDSAIDPHRGYYLLGLGELALTALGSEVQYNKYFGQAIWIQSLWPESELVLSGRLGLAQRRLYADELPISERFFAGGASTVRGYAEDSLGPKDSSGNPLGGDLMVIGNLEWRFDLPLNFKAALFFDTGNVWSNPDDFRLQEIKGSVGGGLRYGTPVGPARLDFGYKLDPEPDEDRYRFHFTLGYPF